MNLPADFFRNEAAHLSNQALIAHEFVHSWNGLYRQPADLWAPTLNSPMRDSLLWVYEGQTEFWGLVLAARSGLLTRQQALDQLALYAAAAQGRPGRAWKSLQDSSSDPLSVIGHGVEWRDWQRREDYYGEGLLLWLDVDTLIRQRTGGARSLDDFARAFFGGKDGDLVTRTYGFDDLCAALNAIAPFDWAGFLRARLDAHDGGHVLDGLSRAGWRLAFTGQPTDSFRQAEDDAGATDLAWSLGLSVTKAGLVRTVAWDGPAFRAGIGVGAKITVVNGRPFDPEMMRAAITAGDRLDLTVESDGASRAVRIEQLQGLRYPRLERVAGAPDRFADLIAPLSARR